jgi:hypothetical protein
MYCSIDRSQVDSSSNRNSMAATSDSPSSLPRPLRSFSPWSVAFRSIIRAYQRQSANPSCLPSSSSSVSVSSVTSSKPLVPLPIARGTRPTTLEMLPSDPARLDFLISPSKCQSTRYVLSLLSCSIIADHFSTRLGSHRRDSRPLSFLPSNRSRRLSRRTSVREEPSRSLFARMVCRSVQLPRTRSRLVSMQTPFLLPLLSSGPRPMLRSERLTTTETPSVGSLDLSTERTVSSERVDSRRFAFLSLLPPLPLS